MNKNKVYIELPADVSHAVVMVNGIEYRHMVCPRCKTSWQISKFKQIPKTGFVCPHCEEKPRKQVKLAKMIKTVLKWLLITLAGVALYLWGAEAAYIERGYRAYGGECLLLFLPILWALAESVINDVKRNYRKREGKSS